MEKQIQLRLSILIFVVVLHYKCSAVTLYPYGTGTGDTAAVANDDGWTYPILLNAPFPFFGRTYSSLYLNTNGLVSFTSGVGQWRPDPISSVTYPIIAPFWADVDTRTGGTIYYRVSRDASLINSVTSDLTAYFGSSSMSSFGASWVFVATWDRVPAFGARPTCGSTCICTAVNTNTFQLILITDGYCSYAIFNYDRVTWLTGTASDGVNPQAGYNDGYGTSYSVPSSGTSSMSNLPTTSNVGLSGRYAMRLSNPTTCSDRGCFLRHRSENFTIIDCRNGNCDSTARSVRVSVDTTYCAGCCPTVNDNTHTATINIGQPPVSTWSPSADMDSERVCCKGGGWWTKQVPIAINTCPTGYTIRGSYCYKIVTGATNWSNARQRCQAAGADLASIDSQSENDYLSTLIQSAGCNSWGVNAWTGLNDLAQSSTWRWVSTGNAPSYTNWSPGEPNHFNNSEHCVSLNGGSWNWKWKDANCNIIYSGCGICKTPVQSATVLNISLPTKCVCTSCNLNNWNDVATISELNPVFGLSDLIPNRPARAVNVPPPKPDVPAFVPSCPVSGSWQGVAPINPAFVPRN